MYKKWLIVAGILIVIGFSGALLTAKSFFSLQNENDKQTKQFQSSEIQSIDVNNTVGTIKLAETSGDEIIVETIGSKMSNPIKIEENGETLSITNEADHTISLGVNFKKSSENITVYLPKKQYDRISASNEVGEITISQINAAHLNAESEVGSIHISDVSSTSIIASSELGNIKIQKYSGKLQVDNEVGSIDISTDEITEPLIAKNELGEIDLTINQDPNNILITADSEIGSKRIFGKKTGSYMSGDGSITVQLSTETGSIRVTD
ncbi:DUF4097 domain-containing protein [Pradoshia sp. D12]|uniref:DUF4097 family beta strand repeat-containing protein n=1 Tax=Bacillaceae TaxID=186817 RepID=UPI001121C845|nr:MULTISPECIES: DUF4097 family beta strand repeat-containing protein [Bacillaceae]QFK72035.1 DUF4097 domain-containing protein [Pradoshia sp. D12]TPF71473.1 DUF4097 domain-containing protein [Bacillus sp. D12]